MRDYTEQEESLRKWWLRNMGRLPTDEQLTQWSGATIVKQKVMVVDEELWDIKGEQIRPKEVK